VTKLAVALLFIALNYYTYHHFARQVVIPERETFEHFPMQLEDWSCSERGNVSEEIWQNLGATDMFLCDYFRGDAGVSVYVGYHATQVREQGGGSEENSIHPPAHCLPGSGWDIIDSRTVPLGLPGLPAGAEAKRIVVARGGSRALVYYWYQSRGRVISEDWQKIAYLGWDRARLGRSDGSLVRFMVPIRRGDEERADREFRELAQLLVPALPPYVPTAR